MQEARQVPTGIHAVEWRPPALTTRWMDYARLKNAFAKVVSVIQPQLVHAGPIQKVALLPALAGFHPLLSMSWGFDLLEDAQRDILWHNVTRFVLRHSDGLITDCQTVKREAVRFGFPAERITVFPWGVDLKLFQPGDRGLLRRQAGYEEDLLIVHTRSWEPRYGVDVALEGFWLASQQEQRLRLFMLGGGSQEEQIKRFVREKGLQERVHFCGYQENQVLSQYYRAADVYLSASHIDGSSVALMEAMACGCPALVSDIPSNLEWVTDGKQGWVFRDSNADNLADRIVEIARTREEVARRGALARQKCEREANWEDNFQKLIGAYDKMILE